MKYFIMTSVRVVVKVEKECNRRGREQKGIWENRKALRGPARTEEGKRETAKKVEHWERDGYEADWGGKSMCAWDLDYLSRRMKLRVWGRRAGRSQGETWPG